MKFIPIVGWLFMVIGSLLISIGSKGNILLIGFAIPTLIVSYDFCFNEKFR
jgi:hypothetical protein|tara:strand:+ start:5606 stop:5758 length:153 start_codon:yes stop_codon:yes gene_type:complete